MLVQVGADSTEYIELKLLNRSAHETVLVVGEGKIDAVRAYLDEVDDGGYA